MFTKLTHYTQGAIRLGQSMFYPETAQQADRLRVCETCPLRADNRCSVCGCFLHAKTKLPDEHCPKGYW